VPEANENHTGEGPLDPERTRLALEESIKRVNDTLATLDEAERTREEVFDLVVSV